jgi:hypothetical protein
MARRKDTQVVAIERVAGSIRVVRGQRVLLDFDLAALYAVETKVLLQAVRRNLERFPADFMLQLTADEWSSLRSQIVASNMRHGGRRYVPCAFTEQGVAMLSSALNSSRAIAVNVEIMRAFVRMRTLLASNEELAQVGTARRFSRHDNRSDPEADSRADAVPVMPNLRSQFVTSRCNGHSNQRLTSHGYSAPCALTSATSSCASIWWNASSPIS